MVQNGWPKPREYDDWRQMLQKEDLEAVHVATPLWTHAEMTVTALNAGKHVLCEKMMAKSAAECQQMIDAATRNKRVLEIGYQRFYNPLYQAAYANIIKPGLLGEIYHARLTWHRNASWRRTEEPPTANFDPSRWGYPDWEHLLNWRVYRKYSEGLLCELGSHQLTAANWFFGANPEAVYTSAGTYQYKDGREVHDHVYAIFNYPGGRTATFSTIQSNAFEDSYEMFLGTKGTLILTHEADAFLFNGGNAGQPRGSKLRRVTPSASRFFRHKTRRRGPARIASAVTNCGFCLAVRTGSQFAVA
jgi:predicted dehydrogenase